MPVAKNVRRKVPHLLAWARRHFGLQPMKSKEVLRIFTERTGLSGRNKTDKYVALERYLKNHATKTATQKKPTHFEVSDAFLESYEWRRLRMQVLKREGARCQCCGATRKDGIRLHVDHIKPRRDFPKLALDPDNLQVLCEVCNHGKGNWDQTDWRQPVEPQPGIAVEEPEPAPTEPVPAARVVHLRRNGQLVH